MKWHNIVVKPQFRLMFVSFTIQNPLADNTSDGRGKSVGGREQHRKNCIVSIDGVPIIVSITGASLNVGKLDGDGLV